MPSTLVHLAVAALVGTALLGREFDARSLGVVLAAAALPDVDTFVGLVLQGAHRSLLHTLLLPLGILGVIVYDTRVREESWLRARWGGRGVRVVWVALAGLTFGGIFPDLFTNGVNAFYPIHDSFYTVDGKLLLSNQRGVVQTFVDLSPDEPARTTENFFYWTGVDPSPGSDPKNAERIFPIAASGIQLMLVLLGIVTTTARLWEERRSV